MQEPLDRFKSKVRVAENGCHEWQASRLPSGYGKFSISRRKWVLAHRWIFEEMNSGITQGNFVCHRCDNPCCVNPEHLFQAPPKGNTKDMIAKGRQKLGEQLTGTKLCADSVREIRSSKESSSQYAKRFHVHPSLIVQVRRRTIWKWVA